MNNYKYHIEGLDCAGCAMKVEGAICDMKEVESAVLNFSTKTLTVKSLLKSDELVPALEKTISKIEDGVTISEYKKHHHEHEEHHHEHNHEHCSCSEHEHHHEHNHEHCSCSEHEHHHEHHHEHKHEHHEISEKGHNCHKYTIEGLDCAGCAMKVESAIRDMKEIEDAVLNFSTKTLTVKSAINSDKLITLLEKTIAKVEDGVIISEQKKKKVQNSDSKKAISNDKIILIEVIAAIVLLAVGLLLKLTNIPEWASMIFMGVSAILAGYRVLIKGFKSIIKLNLNENVLMSVAVIAALCIGEFFEAAAVTILSAIGEMFESKAVDSSRRGIEKLSQIRPDTAHVITEGGIKTIDAEDVEIGAEILVNPYERIPLDGVVYEGSSSIDTSALTGESIPRNVAKNDEVMSGMMNLEGVLKIRTTKSCEDSAAARILKMVEDSAAQKGKAENFITRFAKVYTPIVFVCAIILCALPPLLGLGDFLVWLNRALVFLVASCPCALVISVPLGFYSGIGACSKVGVLVKGGKYIEALSKARSVAFDKTGTLTSGQLSVIKIVAKDGYSEDDIIKLAAAAEQYSSHPAALAIKKRAEGLQLPVLSNNKEKAGYGVSALFKDKEILCGNKRLFSDDSLDNGVIYISVNGNIVGEIYVEDTIREDTPKILKELFDLDFKHIVMLTGDSEQNAANIAKVCGLNEYKASLLPEDKTNEVEKLQSSDKVIFVGDGINDAPVLAKSDCGFAMGLGSEAAIESADAVLVNGTLSQLPSAVRISRRTMSIVRFNIVFALVIKAVILVLAVFGIAPMWLAVIADTGVSAITVLNSSRVLRQKKSDKNTK